jgi:hypothetical protein
VTAVPWGRIVLVDAAGVDVAAWDLAGIGPPDLSVIEQLARRVLVVRRGGGRILLQDVSAELAALLDLTGLAEVAGLGRQVEGKSETREEGTGIEEEMQSGDPRP